MTLREIIQILTACIGSLGFAMLYNVRGKRLVINAIGGLLSWLIFLLLTRVINNEPINYFIVAVLISLYAEVMARVVKTPTTTFITSSLIPLIPGGSLYYTMSFAFRGDTGAFLEKAVYTLQLAAALALGVIVATALTRLLSKLVSFKHHTA